MQRRGYRPYGALTLDAVSKLFTDLRSEQNKRFTKIEKRLKVRDSADPDEDDTEEEKERTVPGTGWRRRVLADPDGNHESLGRRQVLFPRSLIAKIQHTLAGSIGAEGPMLFAARAQGRG